MCVLDSLEGSILDIRYHRTSHAFDTTLIGKLETEAEQKHFTNSCALSPAPRPPKFPEKSSVSGAWRQGDAQCHSLSPSVSSALGTRKEAPTNGEKESIPL